jgi:hypothetical protein
VKTRSKPQKKYLKLIVKLVMSLWWNRVVKIGWSRFRERERRWMMWL